MRANLFVTVAALALAGCFSPTNPVCTFLCQPHTNACPPDYYCNLGEGGVAGDGVCHLIGSDPKAMCPFGTTDMFFAPDMSMPDMPDAAIADMSMPDQSTPDLSMDMAMPDLSMPDLSTPDLSMPDLATPDLATPDLSTPDLATPDLVALPDLATPDLVPSPDLATPPDLMPPSLTNGQACGSNGECISGNCMNSVCAAQTWNVTVGPNGSLVFQPSTLTIHVGDTVQWTWGSSGHTVTSGSSCTPDNTFCSQGAGNCASLTMTFNAGQTFSFTFTTAGTYPYYCAPHCGSGMTGTIVVQ